MSLTGAAIIDSPSAATFSGGTAVTLSSLGISNNTHKLFVDDGASSPLNERVAVEVSVVEPRPSTVAPNGYTQARTKVLFKVPLSLDNGSVTFNTISLVCATDVETTEAERAQLLLYMAQILNDSTFRGSFDDLSLA